MKPVVALNGPTITIKLDLHSPILSYPSRPVMTARMGSLAALAMDDGYGGGGGGDAVLSDIGNLAKAAALIIYINNTLRQATIEANR